MTGKNWFSRSIAGWDPNPQTSGWDRLDRSQPTEDFAADSRAEVSAPKAGA